MNAKHYLVVLEKTETGYSAYSPDVQGCVAADETFDATIRLIAEALEFHCEGMMEHGEELPESKALEYYLHSGELLLEPDTIVTHVRVNIPQPA